MADLNALRQALATALSVIPGLRVFPDFVSAPSPPAAIILPGTGGTGGQVMRFDALGGAVSYLCRIILLVSYTEDASSQALMDSYLSSTGTSSIAAALAANPRLGGACDYCNMEQARGYGLMTWAAQEYLGTQIPVTIAAS